MTLGSKVAVLVNLWLEEADITTRREVWDFVYRDALGKGADRAIVGETDTRNRRTILLRPEWQTGLPIDAVNVMDINLYSGTEWLAGMGERGEELGVCTSFQSWVDLLPGILTIWPEVPFELVRVESCTSDLVTDRASMTQR